MGSLYIGTTPEGDDIFGGCFAGVDDVPDLDASLIFDEAQRLLNQATTLHREVSSKYRAELARCEADLKQITEERDAIKLLYVQQMAELVEQLCEEAKMKEAETLGWKQNMDRLASEKDAEENLARAQKVEELETRLAAELARATSEAEALVASYRADAEAANTRVKEISDATEVRLSRVAEHARRQSHRETLEENEARSLLSDDEDSASGSENGGDEDEAPKDAAPEAN
uniref:Protein TolA-like n=1 Tax=Nicotiana tabacum TaxID=4097 RepID=A0A1S3XSJ5_TOBAC|nr:PREDICTED: protein TolA-like [Nicotiana tabacum]